MKHHGKKKKQTKMLYNIMTSSEHIYDYYAPIEFCFHFNSSINTAEAGIHQKIIQWLTSLKMNAAS